MEAQCRLCLDEDEDVRLITPCKCKGTLSHIHVYCLLREMKSTYSTRCSICKTKYVTKLRVLHDLMGKLYDTEYRYTPPREDIRRRGISAISEFISRCIIIFLLCLWYFSMVISMRNNDPSLHITILFLGVTVIVARLLYDLIRY